MGRYENNGVQPPADTINKLAEVLGTTVDYLINGNSDEPSHDKVLPHARML